MPRDTTPRPLPQRPTPTMNDHAFRSELWRALIIVVRAMIRRYGFRPPDLGD